MLVVLLLSSSYHDDHYFVGSAAVVAAPEVSGSLTLTCSAVTVVISASELGPLGDLRVESLRRLLGRLAVGLFVRRDSSEDQEDGAERKRNQIR